MATNLEGRMAPVAAHVGPDVHRGYVDWAAILAGAVLASAISFVLLTFGSAVGLGAATDVASDGDTMLALLAASGLWLIWVQVSSFAVGGYVTGRLRRRLQDASEHEVHMRDGLHGVLVWGLGILLGGLVAAVALTGVAKGGLEVVKAGIAAAGSVADEALDDGGANGVMGALLYDIDRLMRPGGGGVVSTGAGTRLDQREQQAEIGRILTKGLVAGDVPEDDRTHIARLIAGQAGIPMAEAEQRVDTLIDDAQKASAAAKASAEEAAETARQLGILISLTATVSLLLSATGAWWGSRRGGRHRDEGTVIAFLVPPRRA